MFVYIIFCLNIVNHLKFFIFFFLDQGTEIPSGRQILGLENDMTGVIYLFLVIIIIIIIYLFCMSRLAESSHIGRV